MNWYCVQTKPHKEAFAARYLEKVLGLETYVPMLSLRRTIRRVKRVVLTPLFPRYIFCHFDLGTHFRAVQYGPDVNEVVQSAGRPTVVEDRLITELRDWAGRAVDGDALQARPKPGELVLIAGGVLSGLQAVFLHDLSDNERVEVLLLVLNCGARMVVDRDDLRRVS